MGPPPGPLRRAARDGDHRATAPIAFKPVATLLMTLWLHPVHKKHEFRLLHTYNSLKAL
jgi:hypothetical protein